MTRRTCLLVLSLLIAAVAGCAGTPQPNLYTLTTAVPLTAAPAPQQPVARITIAALSLPELVDRPQLVVPDGANRVLLLESQRWAEPLKYAVPRTLATNLARLLPAAQVSFQPHYASTEADYRIFIDITSFEYRDATVVVEANWNIKTSSTARTPITGRSRQTVPVAGDGYEPLVAAYSTALAGLATTIAHSLPPLSP